MVQGACIPGLSMAAKEFPSIPGAVTLENPEVGGGVWLDRDYSLEEVAEMHVASIACMVSSQDPTLCGYSMGGMILAIMATVFRSKLPARARFVFLMTSANLEEPATAPAVRPAVKNGT